MKTTWKLQDAKSQFSKVVNDAVTTGPQFVTRRGIEAVVIVSVKEYETLISNQMSFKEFLLSIPKIEECFITERQKDYPGSIEF